MWEGLGLVLRTVSGPQSTEVPTHGSLGSKNGLWTSLSEQGTAPGRFWWL